MADHPCLVGYFVGSRPPYSAVNATAHKLWGSLGADDPTDHFFFQIGSNLNNLGTSPVACMEQTSLSGYEIA